MDFTWRVHRPTTALLLEYEARKFKTQPLQHSFHEGLQHVESSKIKGYSSSTHGTVKVRTLDLHKPREHRLGLAINELFIEFDCTKQKRTLSPCSNVFK